MKLEGMVPNSPARLREWLLMIFDGRPFLAFAGVNVASAALDIVWHRQAAADGYRSVYIPLRRDALAPAQRLVEHLLSQMAMGLPPSQASAAELFDMVDRRAIADVDRPDYDGITPADALAAAPRGPSTATDQGEDRRSGKRRDINDLT
ncbi:MAG TPA: hypothetical protein VJR58_30820 [Vineibacter sp.]|nr:hypothetical protein [Vineibacter sp.]